MSRTRIAVDVMSGDNAPKALVRGAIKAMKEADVEIVFVGEPQSIKNEAHECGYDGELEIEEAYTVIDMCDAPSSVMNEKKDSSMAVAVRLLKEDRVDAVVSAGNTGALFTAASLMVRRINGVRRAALAAVVPVGKPFILLDSGANTEVLPENLCQFAYMGTFYAREMLGIENPRVGLLNNGTERTKGTPLQTEAYKLLEKENINFAGNCEARDLPFGSFDVVVCDGFTGNVAIKVIEGMGALMGIKLKELFRSGLKNTLAALIIKKDIEKLKKSMDHKVHGGAPILGIKKPVIKAHGSADEKTVYYTVLQAKNYYESGITEKIARINMKGGVSE